MSDGLAPTSGVLLAAGGGRRMGRPKAELLLGGRTLLERGLRMLREAGCDPLFTVVGASAAAGSPRVDDVRDQSGLGERHGLVAACRAGRRQR